MDRKYDFSNGYIIESHNPNELKWKFLLSLYPNGDNLTQLRKEVISRLPPNQNYIVATPFHIAVGEKADASSVSH